MDLAAYHAAHESCVRMDGADRAWLEVTGPDAHDFLQRVLSSDLRTLAPGGGQWSALLDGKGHWIADLLLYRPGGGADDAYGLDVPAERADVVAQRLAMLHFSERLEIRRGAGLRLLLLGPLAARHAAGLGLPVPSEHGGFGALRAGSLLLLRRPDRGVPALEILGAEEELHRINTGCAEAEIPGAGAEVRETLRIEGFVPRWGADFDEETTLPASNEWRRASVTKGCYAGQEVVARVNTYGEAPRQLCRLRFEGDGTAPMAGAELVDDDGRLLGAVTSWTWSPRADGAVGLGALRRRGAVNGARVRARRDGIEAIATVEVPPKELG